MPDINISLIADYEPTAGVFDNIEIIEEPEYNFIDKISHLDWSPYDETLYLDSDIYVHKPIPEVFDSLERFDMSVSLDAHQQSVIPNKNYDAPGIYGEYTPVPEFNTGLIAYKNNSKVQNCLDIWEQSYDSTTHWAGQPSYIPGFYNSNVRVCPLPRRYNFIPGIRNSVSGEVKVFHNRLQGGPDPGFKDLPPEQIPQLINRVNRSREARVTYPYTGELTHYTDLEVLSQDPLPIQFLKSIWRRGPFKAGKAWLRRIKEYN